MSKDQKEICAYCRYWEPNSREAAEKYTLIANGRCRIRAPELVSHGNKDEGLYSSTAWPSVQGGDWCGEFKGRRDDWQSIGDAASDVMANLRRKMDENK